MSIENPAKYYKVNITDTSGGGMITPSGKEGFVWLCGQNTDSSAIKSWGVNFANVTSPTDTAVNEYVGTASHTSGNLNPTSYGNGASLNAAFNSSYIFQYPGYSYTTSYPRFMTVNWWDQEGGYE